MLFSSLQLESVKKQVKVIVFTKPDYLPSYPQNLVSLVQILEISSLTPEQIPEIVVLDRLCLGGLWTAEGYLREIDSPNSSLLTLNLINRCSPHIKTKMIGMACLWAIAEEAHITLLGIDPEYRRQGFATWLLLTLLEQAIARKLEWATLEVNVNNIKAINLYKKFGFIEAGTRKGYYQSTGEDASILWLKAIQHPQFKLSLAQWQQNLEQHWRDLRYRCYKKLNC